MRVDDSIATNGFDANLFPYFAGNYDKCHVVRMGVPTPKHCIKVSEVPAEQGFLTDIEIQFNGGVTISEVVTGISFLGISGSFLVTFDAAKNSMKFQANTNGNEFATLSTITISGSANNSGTRAIFATSIVSQLVNDKKHNKLLFQKWFFMQRNIDVWGRPSEWGPRSLEYVPGVNDCTNSSNNIARCLNLELDAGDPFTNAVEIGWINCINGEPTVWHKEETLFLYEGSNIGEWWKRPRNPKIDYNQTTNKITYKFCREKECDIIPIDETNRLENPLPKRSKAIMELNNETALFNNKSKFNPFSQELKDKIKVEVIPPTEGDLGLRSITIYCPIYNEYYQSPTDSQGKFVSVVQDNNNGFYFGGITSNGQYNGAWADRYQQRFKNKAQSGFGGYLVGGGSVISTQVVEQNDGTLLDDPTHTLGTNQSLVSYQKFVFTNIKKGKYIFRLYSQLADSNTEANYRETSTTVWGVCSWARNGSRVRPDAYSRSNFRSQELLIDVCDKDYDTFKDDTKMIVIADMAAVVQGGEYKALGQYVYETNKNGYNQTPVELLNIVSANGTNSQITDHNGFLWYSTRGKGRSYAIDNIYECVSRQLRYGQSNVAGFVFQQNIYTEGTLNKPCNRVLIKGKVLLQGTAIGISNATVCITRGASAVTDENGGFVIIAHDFVLDYFSGKYRKEKLVISSVCDYDGLCVDVDVTLAACTKCNERITVVNTITLSYQSEKSLLSGGVYPVGCVGWDWLGRATFVQPLGLIEIPAINEIKNIAPSQVKITIDPAATFPSEIEYLTFWIAPETTIEKYLSWIVDKVEFIDAQGLVNDLNPTQIKIYYGSILEFSKLNNFNTTTAWDFIPEKQTTPILNDRVRFFINGDGKFFDKAISALIKYDKTGLAFTIDYSTDLKELKQNALIRLERLKNCTGNEPFREICSSKVEIVNRKATRNSFILDAYDTYYLNRAFPVPAPVTDAPTASITTTVISGNTSVATQQIPLPTPTVLELRLVGFRFEHFAPSNYWGSGCIISRLQVKNPYEAELIQPYQVALSGSLSINGQLNYLCYFDDRKTNIFQVPECGGITSAIQKIGGVFVICQTKCFIVGYNDNLGRLNNDGIFQANSVPDSFGKPQSISDNGCHEADKLAIQFGEGKIMWIDRVNAEAVQSDFQSVKSFTKDKANGWFKAKIKQVLSDAGAYFTGAITPAGEYLVTNQTITDAMKYINAERTYNALVPETFSFHIGSRELIQWFGFTAENYSFLNGDILNNQMFSFKEGKSYSHYNGKQNNSFNVFFGVQTEKVIRIVFRGEDAFKKKMFMAITNWCENQLFFADEIRTEAKQFSRLLLAGWDKAVYFSIGAFLADLNSIPDPNLPDETGANKLMDGDRLTGCWIDIRLIGDIDKNNAYCEILGFDVLAVPYENS